MRTAAPRRTTLYVKAGATFARDFRLLDGDRQPVSRTGWTAKFQARRDADSPGSPIVETTPAIEGEVVHFILTAAQTSALSGYPEVVGDIELYSPGPGPTYEPTETPILLKLVIDPEVVR